MANGSRKSLAGLRRQMDQHFNLDEIELLCFELGIDYEHLAGAAKPKKIHELIMLVVRNGRLPELLELLAEERSTVAWPELPEDFDPAPDESLAAGDQVPVNQFQMGDAATGSTVAGNMGEGAVVAGAGATVVGAGGSLTVQKYRIDGDIAGDVNIAGDVHITTEELPIPAPPDEEPLPIVEGFVGRESELERFSTTLRTAHMAVISGMAGIGKTTLAATLARQSAAPENIFWHTFHQGEGIEGIIWQLAGFLARRGQDDLWQLLQRTRLTRGQLPPTETLLDYLVQLLRGGNYLLCFDDLHLAGSDPKMDLFVGRARTAVIAGELSLIITSRRLPEYVTLVDTAFIDGLSAAAAQQMLQQRGVELPSELIDKLHERTQGNAELLSLAAEMLRSTQYPERLLDNLAEARDVERFLMSEINAHLSEFEPEVMDAVSVLCLFGHMGTRHAVAAILDGQNVRRVIRDLCDRFLLNEHSREEGNEYSQHTLVQAFYYDGLSRRQRQAMHRLAGQFYQDEEPDPMRATIHYERAGETQLALQLVFENVWELLNLGHGPALVELLGRIPRPQVVPEQWLQVKMAQGQVLAFLGVSGEAQASYQEALSLLANQPNSTAVRRQRARAYRGLGELLQQESPEDALTWLRRGLAEDVTIEPTEEAGLYIAIGTIEMWLGRYDEAAMALENGLALLPDGPSQLRATALQNLGVVAVEFEGDVDKGVALALEALQISRVMRDHFKTAEILNTLGSYRYQAGDWSGAMADFLQAKSLSEQVGSEKALAYSSMTLGTAYIDLGDNEEAESHLQQGLRLARKTNQLYDACFCLIALSDLKGRQHEWALARDHLLEVEELADQLEIQWFVPIILRGFAQVKQASGELLAAYVDAQRAVDMTGESGEAVQLGISQRVLAEIALELGRAAEAMDLFETSAAILDDNYPYEAARTQAQWGRMLIADGDMEEGLLLLEQAQATFQRLGARRDLADVNLHLNG
jgi:ATP/maltotriose-dependent transcriptional regulator MalT